LYKKVANEMLCASLMNDRVADLFESEVKEYLATDFSPNILAPQPEVIGWPDRECSLRNRRCSDRRRFTFPDKSSLIVIANNAIKPYIPRIWRNLLDLLALERNADQFRLNPVFAVS